MIAHAAFDVLIAGGGPAGLAAAITLARCGLHVGIVDRGRPVASKGETLASMGAVVLRELGVWNAVLRAPHRPCHAYRAIWGSPQMTYLDGLRDPRGSAWMVDRSVLVACLQERALEMGVVFLTWLAPLELSRSKSGWAITSGAGGRSFSARFLVDATGRASAVARRLGVRRSTGDRQIALLAAFPGNNDSCREPMLVEAVEDGWWYLAESPQAGLVLAYFTDRDLIDARATRDRVGFQALLARSTATYERARGAGRSLGGRPSMVRAESSVLCRACGEGWIAVGDAALAYDPLSGHGLTVALASGRDAALTVQACLSNDRSALLRYQERLACAWRAYEHRRAIQYSSERRWIEHPFWQRRSGSKARPMSP